MRFWFSSDQFRLGILGGGQLGRMLLQEAINLNINTSVLDPDAQAPCRHLCREFVCGDFRDERTVYEFGKRCSMVTVEIEDVSIHGLLRLEAEGVVVYPQPLVLQMVQDKGVQKEFFAANGIPTASFALVSGREELGRMQGRLPGMLKLRRGGYDGKGVLKISGADQVPDAFDAPCVLEELVEVKMELSVIVARGYDGEIRHFPPVEMEFNPTANLVEFLCSPARISETLEEEAVGIARKVIECAGMTGLLAVEMFVTRSGEVLVNESAPRPHNSGHQTIEGNVTSQYHQHLRAILGLPLGNTDVVMPSAMVNLLGEPGHSGPAHYEGIEACLGIGGVHVHLYGKLLTKPLRKMGHVTITERNSGDLREKAQKVKQLLRVISR